MILSIPSFCIHCIIHTPASGLVGLVPAANEFFLLPSPRWPAVRETDDSFLFRLCRRQPVALPKELLPARRVLYFDACCYVCSSCLTDRGGTVKWLKRLISEPRKQAKQQRKEARMQRWVLTLHERWFVRLFLSLFLCLFLFLLLPLPVFPRLLRLVHRYHFLYLSVLLGPPFPPPLPWPVRSRRPQRLPSRARHRTGSRNPPRPHLLLPPPPAAAAAADADAAPLQTGQTIIKHNDGIEDVSILLR